LVRRDDVDPRGVAVASGYGPNLASVAGALLLEAKTVMAVVAPDWLKPEAGRQYAAPSSKLCRVILEVCIFMASERTGAEGQRDDGPTRLAAIAQQCPAGLATGPSGGDPRDHAEFRIEDEGVEFMGS
jgi:hypothetical protein